MEHGQTFCPTDDGYEDFQEREESILEVFDTNITAIRGQARKLLNLSNILTGLSDLTCDITAIESSLTEDPNSVHSSSLHSLESSFLQTSNGLERIQPSQGSSSEGRTGCSQQNSDEPHSQGCQC